MTSSDLQLVRLLTEDMSKQEKFQFQSLYQQRKKSVGVAVVLALLLGGVGAQHFYMGRIGNGVIFALFCWTFIPAILSLIQCCFLGSEIRYLNERIARDIAAEIEAFR